MKTYTIKFNTSIQRIHIILQELNMSTSIDPLIYVKLGYKQLSTQDKETYYLLRDLGLLNLKEKKEIVCSPSLDYLATALNTTVSCQKKRIKKLQSSGLISIKNNCYICNKILPDSTFVTTMSNLIRRKRLSEFIVLYNNDHIPTMRIEILLNIVKLLNKGATHPNIESIIGSQNPLDFLNNLQKYL
jgi:hypothetical protein